MATIIKDITVGTDRTTRLSLKLADGTYDDLTGDTFTLRIKKNMDDTDAQALITVVGTIITEDARTKAKFVFTKAATSITPANNLFIDIERVTSGVLEYVPYDNRINLKRRSSDV